MRGSRTLGAVCIGSLAVQSFHMLEHVVQVLQKFVWNVPAHGLLGEAFDREWVHMAYNGTLEALFLVMLVGYGLWSRDALRAFPGGRPWGLYTFWALIGFQGYHTAEHVVKMYQYLATGVSDTPGLLGQIFPTILVHFAFNVIVLLMMVMASVGLRMTQRAIRDLRAPSISRITLKA